VTNPRCPSQHGYLVARRVRGYPWKIRRGLALYPVIRGSWSRPRTCPLSRLYIFPGCCRLDKPKPPVLYACLCLTYISPARTSYSMSDQVWTPAVHRKRSDDQFAFAFQVNHSLCVHGEMYSTDIKGDVRGGTSRKGISDSLHSRKAQYSSERTSRLQQSDRLLQPAAPIWRTLPTVFISRLVH